MTGPPVGGDSHYGSGMWLTLFASVFAATPSVTTDDAGVVHARMVVAAPPAEVLALVRDPDALHRLSDEGSTVTNTPDGSCYRIAYALDTPIATVAYTARGCPTPTGFETKLEHSDSFRAMTSRWSVREVPDGSEVSYTYAADVSLPVPGFIVRRSTHSAIAKVMTKVAAAFAD